MPDFKQLHDRLTKEIAVAFADIKASFVQYETSQGFPELFSAGDDNESARKNTLLFKAVDTEYALTAKILPFNGVMYFETTRLKMSANAAEKVYEAIPELTVVYGENKGQSSGGEIALYFNLPKGSNSKRNYQSALLGKTFVPEFWEYVKKQDTQKLKSITG